jgi:hypothetical protein
MISTSGRLFYERQASALTRRDDEVWLVTVGVDGHAAVHGDLQGKREGWSAEP